MNESRTDAQKWKRLKIINLALMSGATMFLLVCGIVIYTSTGKAPSNEGNMMTFALMVGATWVVSQMLKLQIGVLFRRKLAGEDPFPVYHPGCFFE